MPSLPKYHAEVEELRRQLPTDPRGVLEKATAQLEMEDLPEPDRLRFLGLAVTGSRKLDDSAQAESWARVGLRLKCRSALAWSDFWLHVAVLRIVQSNEAEARELTGMALEAIHQALASSPGSSRESQRRREWLEDEKAVALITRGEIGLHLEGDLETAIADAILAMKITEDFRRKERRRVINMSSVTLLCALLEKWGPRELFESTLDLLKRIDERAGRSLRLRRNHPHRLRLAWCRALVVARMGSLEEADRLLKWVFEQLKVHGLRLDARLCRDAWVWIMERAGKLERAAYLQRLEI